MEGYSHGAFALVHVELFDPYGSNAGHLAGIAEMVRSTLGLEPLQVMIEHRWVVYPTDDQNNLPVHLRITSGFDHPSQQVAALLSKCSGAPGMVIRERFGLIPASVTFTDSKGTRSR